MTGFEIKKTTKKGWGVFAIRNFKKNELVTAAPVVVMSAAEMKLLDDTRLHDYIFHWGEEGGCCMALGNVPIFNHAAPSNCEYFQDNEGEQIEIYTVKNIKKGEELTINYNGDANNNDRVWFETA